MHPAFRPAWLAALVAAPLAAQTRSAEVQRYVSVEAPVVALTNAILVDGTGAPARRGQTVVIRGNRIAEVGPAGRVQVPADARVVDASGHTVIPGMVGLHDHLFYTAGGGRVAQMVYTGPRLYLGAGVTTIRTTGANSPYSDLNVKRAIESGAVPGPRVHLTAPYLTGARSQSPAMVAVGSPEAARRFVAYWAEEGATWLKIYTDIHREELAAAIDEAHKRGLKVTGHLCSISFQEAVELGIDNLEHGLFTASDVHPAKEPDRCPTDLIRHVAAAELDGPAARAAIAAMVQRGVPVTSTLPVYEAFVPGRPVTDQRSLDAMAPEVRERYLADRAQIDRAANPGFNQGVLRKAMDFEVAFVRAGGLLAAGVDPTGNGGALPGFGDQRGYELLREAGFTTEEAVRIVTLNGARVLGVDGDLGSVQAGKLADLVLIRGDLTADPSVIRNVVTVFKDGVGYDSARLIEAVRGRVGIN